MRMTIAIPARALRNIQRRFGSLASLRWLRKPIRDSYYYMLHSIEKNFRMEGRPQRWRAWSPKYKERVRDKIGPPHQILQLSGKIDAKNAGTASERRTFALKLKRSVQVGRVGRRGWIIGTNVVYARIQQKGGTTGHYGQSQLPARPFLLFHRQDITVIRALFNAHIQKFLVF